MGHPSWKMFRESIEQPLLQEQATLLVERVETEASEQSLYARMPGVPSCCALVGMADAKQQVLRERLADDLHSNR